VSVAIGGKRIALNTLFLSGSSILNLGISLVTTSVIARSIGPELYGRYTFGLNYILMFSVFANCGLESLFIREAARDRNNLLLINDIFPLKIVLSIFTTGIIILSAHLLNYPSATMIVLYILCGGLIFQILSECLLSVYRSVERIHVTAFFASFFRVISGVIIGIAVISGMGFYGIVSAFTIGNFMTFLSVLIFFGRDFKLLSLRVAVSRWVKLILRGSPFYFSALLTMLYSRIGILVLSKLVSDREIGFYLAALNLIENLYFVPTAFVTSVFPVFSRLHGSSVDALKKAYARMMKYLVILTVAVAVGTLLVSKEVIEFIYGGEFESTVPILKILIFLWVLVFFNNIQSTLLFSVKKEMVQVKILMVVVVCNALLNLILVSLYGYMGAAFASVATEGIMVVLLSAVLWKMEFRYVPDNCAFRLIAVAGSMTVLVYFMLKMNLIVAVIGGALSYVGLLFALKVFDEEDMLFMRAIVQRRSGNE